MPRRPNIKNLPSRLFEECQSPIYMVDRDMAVVYANPALADILSVDREKLVGAKLEYCADVDFESDSLHLSTLCPPPRIWGDQAVFGNFTLPGDLSKREPGAAETITSTESKSFPVLWKDGQQLQAHGLPLLVNSESGEQVLVCSLLPPDGSTFAKKDADWLHQEVQRFRQRQAGRNQTLPYLGESPLAQRCFAQAGAYALLQANVLITGHPQSQVLDVARAIHYAGFVNVEDPDPLLPVDCRQVKGERIQEILIGHCQVTLAEKPGNKAYVLLMHAEHLDELAQRDLLSIGNVDQLPIRFISTAQQPLFEVDGFDKELASRLTVLETRLPSLASRRSDVPLLAQVLVEECSSNDKILSDELIELFQVYTWTSDYEELARVVRSACQTCAGMEIRLSDCPHDFRMALKAMENPIPKMETMDLDALLDEVEREAIHRAVAAANGNKTVAARSLGITRARLHRKLADENDSSQKDC